MDCSFSNMRSKTLLNFSGSTGTIKIYLFLHEMFNIFKIRIISPVSSTIPFLLNELGGNYKNVLVQISDFQNGVQSCR